MPKVLVVDDQILVRSGLAALLRAAPDIEVVAEADSGEEAVGLAAELRPDVILMDVRMPGMGGIAATAAILEQAPAPHPRVIMLTTFDLDAYVYDALRAGASGYLLKNTPPQRLLAAIHTVHAGDTLLSPAALAGLMKACAPGPERSRTRPRLDCLTPREVEILTLVGTGLSNTEIAGRLVLSPATIKTHVHRCMNKLALSSRAQAVVFAYEAGLISA
ncbi:response regulator transcription factor [Streptomyces sp. RerS4]|uniref:response regulator n=1 Tax=Streptomyces sp. RerS4 TaxID=2942449 RepID=UPI00201C3DC0|nr:response regulator transcription factor [Streptomyces sp. RerS4]UQW99469.1 response regulator transcription factor [Streptomyces sp. RerS4]